MKDNNADDLEMMTIDPTTDAVAIPSKRADSNLVGAGKKAGVFQYRINAKLQPIPMRLPATVNRGSSMNGYGSVI
jgi:hypothetical protein